MDLASLFAHAVRYMKRWKLAFSSQEYQREFFPFDNKADLVHVPDGETIVYLLSVEAFDAIKFVMTNFSSEFTNAYHLGRLIAVARREVSINRRLMDWSSCYHGAEFVGALDAVFPW